MFANDSIAILEQLRSYTKDISKLLGVGKEQNGRNSYGSFASGQPTGAITHYTASNRAVTERRPYGRIPVLLSRFAPNSTQKVGVHFIVWDEKVERFAEIRDRYDLIRDMPGEVFFMGANKAYWHAGWFNKFSYGIEIRNLGRLTKNNKGQFLWGRGLKYFGREPIKIGRSYWEPYTWQQMAATLWIHRLMVDLYPTIRPERFLGHTHVSSTRIDPGKHFPLHEMREFSLNRNKRGVFIEDVPWLSEFHDDPDIYNRTDIPLDWGQCSEAALHEGLYRHDWDGTPEEIMDDGEFQLFSGGSYYGEDDKYEVWDNLRALGYYPGLEPDSREFTESIRIFQSRWKRRVKGRFRQEMKATGHPCKETVKRIDQMINRLDTL